jgi:AP-4 complex subunit mu-1
VEGINFFYTKKFGIYFVATTKHNVSPSFVMDILYRMMKVFRDYCGILNEESIRKNFVLIYEIIDEIIDYGHPQLMTTENIKQFIVNEPVLIQNKPTTGSNFRPTIFSSNTIASTAIQRPMSQITDKKNMKNEIFVDIFEKLTVLFNSNGYVINSSIDGVIQMKSYL